PLLMPTLLMLTVKLALQVRPRFGALTTRLTILSLCLSVKSSKRLKILPSCVSSSKESSAGKRSGSHVWTRECSLWALSTEASSSSYNKYSRRLWRRLYLFVMFYGQVCLLKNLGSREGLNG